MTRRDLDGRVGKLEAKAPRPRDPQLDEIEQWFEAALGCPLGDLNHGDLARVIQLLEEAPDFAHPLLLRCCVARDEDREPEEPKLPKDWPWKVGPQGQRYQARPDTPEWRVYGTWQRRRWGYMTAANDPVAMELAKWIEAWAVWPDRAYLRGTDLRLMLARVGVEKSTIGYLELRRLAALCAALDELALEYPMLEAPCEVFWAVLGWAEHHHRRAAVG